MRADFETIVVSRHDDHILLVTLNRPNVSNALNTRMGLDLMEVFEQLAIDLEDLRVAIVTGQGDKAFCAGGDLKERNEMSDESWRAEHLIFERMVRAMMACPIPLLAAVYGASTARFALTEVTLGIMPGAGGTQNLARAVGERRAKELILSGRPFTALEAEAWGLVNRVVEPADLVESTLAIAGRIAANGPLAVRQAKQAVHRGLQMSVWDGLAFEIEAYNRLVTTEDRREGVLAFNERRKPIFRGR